MIDEIECVSSEIAALKAAVVEYRVVKAELGLVEQRVLDIEARGDVVADREVKQGVLQAVLEEMLRAMEKKVDALAERFVRALRNLGLDVELASYWGKTESSEGEPYSDAEDALTVIDWKDREDVVRDDFSGHLPGGSHDESGDEEGHLKNIERSLDRKIEIVCVKRR